MHSTIFFACGLVVIRHLMHIVEYLPYTISFSSSIIVSSRGHQTAGWWPMDTFMFFGISYLTKKLINFLST
jgi:hypothetical protein